MDYKSISYEDCFQCIARHANELLELFSDHWLRFPEYQAARVLIDRLEQSRTLYANSDNPEWRTKAEIILSVQRALAYHAKLPGYSAIQEAQHDPLDGPIFGLGERD